VTAEATERAGRRVKRMEVSARRVVGGVYLPSRQRLNTENLPQEFAKGSKGGRARIRNPKSILSFMWNINEGERVDIPFGGKTSVPP